MKPGQELFFGRSPDVEIPIPRSSVSLKHLRLHWTGIELKIEDLKSSNGTFRMPQNSPFLEAAFPPRFEGLKLRLSKSDVELDWQPLIQLQSTQIARRSEQEPTATEVAPHREILPDETHGEELREPAPMEAPGAPPPAAPAELPKRIDEAYSPGPTSQELPIVESDVAPPQKNFESLPYFQEQKSAQEARRLAASVPIEATVSDHAALTSRALNSTSDEALHAAIWVQIASALGFLTLVSVLLGRRLLMGIAQVPGSVLRAGGIKDVLILYCGLVQSRMGEIVSTGFVLVLGLWLFSRRAAQKGKSPSATLKLARTLQDAGLTPKTSLRILSFFLLCSIFVWPLFWSLLKGATPSALRASSEFWKITQLQDIPDSYRTQKLRALLPALDGSSLLYKQIFNTQRARVIHECDGVGETASWDNKKVCLLLLTAVGIESFEETKPALILDVAARTAVLLSLDGITRVVAKEGKDAPTIPFFLNSLDAIGLNQEGQDILSLLQRPHQSDEESAQALRELRRRIEMRLDALQVELNYPNLFRIRVPGPLETGI